jgi:hypothetical protein
MNKQKYSIIAIKNKERKVHVLVMGGQQQYFKTEAGYFI